jgi:hypothetical protein
MNLFEQLDNFRISVRFALLSFSCFRYDQVELGFFCFGKS